MTKRLYYRDGLRYSWVDNDVVGELKFKCPKCGQSVHIDVMSTDELEHCQNQNCGAAFHLNVDVSIVLCEES